MNGSLQDVQLAAAGDVEAFEKIYSRYHTRVYSLCLRMTRSQSDAEDLAQEVFVQLFRKIGTFRGEASFATWLHRLTVNQVLMHFRKPVVRMEETTEDGAIAESPCVAQNRVQMSVVNSISLEAAVKQLSPGYRAVFILHDVEGYEHEQIGRMLGCTIGTSKSQLHKARMKLRLLLKKGPNPRHQSRGRSKSLELQPQVVCCRRYRRKTQNHEKTIDDQKEAGHAATYRFALSAISASIPATSTSVTSTLGALGNSSFVTFSSLHTRRGA